MYHSYLILQDRKQNILAVLLILIFLGGKIKKRPLRTVFAKALGKQAQLSVRTILILCYWL